MIRKDPERGGATKSMSCNYRAHVLKLQKPVCLGACALQQEKPPQWEAMHVTKSNPCSQQPEESPHCKEDPELPETNKYKYFLKKDYCSR